MFWIRFDGLTGFVSLKMITVFEILAFGFMDVIGFWVTSLRFLLQDLRLEGGYCVFGFVVLLLILS